MNTETRNGMQMTLEQFMPPTSRQPTAGASDSLARISALPENRSAFTATVQACFSELCTFLDKPRKQRNPLTCSLRTLRICLVLMEDGISPDFSLSWTKTGTMRSGRFSTLNTSASRRTENVVLLSDILEVEVPQKYFLSKEQTERIIFTESDTEKDTDETHKIGGVGEKNFGKQWRQGNRIYDGEKIATALEAQPVGNTGGNTNLYAVEVTGFNATRNSGGGGITDTALTLMARDYKGLGNQMMTTAMMCLQSTRESDQKNVMSQTASK